MRMYELLALIAGHFVGDWAFQDDWFAQHKKASHEIMIYHVAVYVSAVFLSAAIFGIRLPWPTLLILFASHFVTDTLSSRKLITNKIWVDQLIHGAFLVIVWRLT